jgi:hypothetical protein
VMHSVHTERLGHKCEVNMKMYFVYMDWEQILWPYTCASLACTHMMWSTVGLLGKIVFYVHALN